MRSRVLAAVFGGVFALLSASAPAHASTDQHFSVGSPFATLNGTIRWVDHTRFTIPNATLKDTNCSDGKQVYWFIRWNVGWVQEGRGSYRWVDSCASQTWYDVHLSQNWIHHVEFWVCRDDWGVDACSSRKYINPYRPDDA
jgi:hypothetical protein